VGDFFTYEEPFEHKTQVNFIQDFGGESGASCDPYNAVTHAITMRYYDAVLVRCDGRETPEKEKLVLKQECELVTLMTVVRGQLELTTSHLYFYDLSPVREDVERQDFKVSVLCKDGVTAASS
jgi:hypothetical protein